MPRRNLKDSEFYIPPEERTDQMHGEDVLSALMGFFFTKGKSRVDRRKLHSVWELFMHLFAKEGGRELKGFYQDITTGKFEALDDAIHHLLAYGLIEYRMGAQSRDDFILTFIPRVIAKLTEDLSEEDQKALQVVAPIIYTAYESEYSLEKLEEAHGLRPRPNPSAEKTE